MLYWGGRISKKECEYQGGVCNRVDYCKGFDDMILCQKCLKKMKEKEMKKKESNNKKKEGN